jgi:hypothetical protein
MARRYVPRPLFRHIFSGYPLDATTSAPGDGVSRVLRRPLGGWSARIWRREVMGWLWLAFLVVGSWAALNMLGATIAVLAGTR